jgi:TonB family protein
MSATRLALIIWWLGSVANCQGGCAMNALQDSTFAPGVERVGPGVTAPEAVFKLEPEYSEEARKALVNSTLGLAMTIRENGSPSDVRVIRGAGFGLDERAIEAVQKWRFRPGTREGKPVAIAAMVEINFRQLVGGHDGQTARLRFSLPNGATRPILSAGRIPKNPAVSGDQSLRIRVQVDEKGKTRSVAMLAATDREWAEKAVHELSSWRFRPAVANGEPISVEGVFELVHGRERSSKEPVPATASTESATQAHPVSAEQFYRNASGAMNRHDEQAAVRALDEAIRLKPGFAAAYLMRAAAQLKLKRYQDVINDANEAIRYEPSNLRGYLLRGEAYSYLHQHAKALDDFNLYIERHPDSAAGYNDRGWAYRELGELVKAVQDFDRAIQLNPSYQKAFENRGLAYLKLSEWAKAEDDFAVVISIQPNRAWAYARRAEARAGKGDSAGAVSDRAKCLELGGDY